jgi:2-octaprenylphenol hydroxylase
VFLPTGPLAFLPLLPSATSSIVWSLPRERAGELLSLEEEVFKVELARAFSHRLGEILEVDARYAHPLHKQQAKTYIKPRVALVGDAAHTMHPLAGQGANLGLLDAMSLVDVVTDALALRRDIGSFTTLRRYERWRVADNFALLNGVDMIKQLFASDNKWLQVLRSVGLGFTEETKWLKNIFTRHAVGDRRDLPRFALYLD